jgi:hypothetical protein
VIASRNCRGGTRRLGPSRLASRCAYTGFARTCTDNTTIVGLDPNVSDGSVGLNLGVGPGMVVMGENGLGVSMQAERGFASEYCGMAGACSIKDSVHGLD